MKKLVRTGYVLLCLLLAVLPMSAGAIDTDNIIDHNSFSEGADYTEIFYMDSETGYPMTAFIDRQGRYVSCTYQEDTYKKIGAAGPYSAFLREVPEGEYYVADLSQNKIVFSSADIPCDEIQKIAYLNGHCYISVYKKEAGFDEVVHRYTIYDENGQTVQQKTFSSAMESTKYLGEGWFLYTEDLGLRFNLHFINAETGEALDLDRVSRSVQPVCGGYTCVAFDGAYHVLNLKTGSTEEIEILDSSSDDIMICGHTENKLVGIEYINTIQQTKHMPAVDVFYYTPGKGKVSIEGWSGHVRAYGDMYPYGLNQCKFVNGRLLLTLMGADGCSYVGLVDEDGQQVMGPLKTDQYVSYAADSDRIVVLEDGISVVYDVYGNELFRATDYGIQKLKAYSGGFAEGGNNIIIDPDGKQLISDFYIDTHSIPMLPLSGN